ncbi:MAG: diguanylate cyclase [bacterium]
MKVRNALTLVAAVVAVATLVLAGIEVARRFDQRTSLFELLFAICAVATSLICIGVLDWARNLRRGAGGHAAAGEDYATVDRSYAAATEAEAQLIQAIHKLEAAANEELGQARSVEEALDIVARYSRARVVSLWTVDESGEMTPRAEHREGQTVVGQEAVAESVDPSVLRDVVELRKDFQKVDQEAATYVLPLAINQQCTGVLEVVASVEGEEDERRDAAQELGAALRELAPHLARAVRAPDLYEEAVSDRVTGLYTRRHFINRLTESTGASRRYGEPLSLVLLDVDSFKMCNQNYGVDTGDRVLLNVATLIQDNVREADSAYRYGADEFAIILPETDVDRACKLAERLRSAVRTHRVVCDEGGTIITTVSGGVAEFDEDMRGIGPLMARAEEALYVAKNRGRDRVERWTEGAAEHVEELAE